MSNKLVPIEHKGQRVITTELLAQVYETDTDNIKHNFNNHKDNFKEGIHYFLLKGEALRAFKREVNDIPLVAPNVNRLYLWTERGANRHCKILDTPKAWEQFDNLEETYFLVKEHQKAIKEKPSKLPPLSSVNMAMKLQTEFAKAAGVAPEYIQAALSKAYDPYGIAIPSSCLPESEKLYECGAVAQELGIFSKSGEPHNKAVSAIIGLVGTQEGETKTVPFTVNGYSNATTKYTPAVMERVRGWLEEQGYPTVIHGADGKNYTVRY